MKLQLSQALATVLDIQISHQGKAIYYTTRNWVYVELGEVGSISLEQAIWKAMEAADFNAPSSFAVFPIASGREVYYMDIERELLRQEISPAFEGKPMWRMMDASDPRELVEQVMLQIRECATSVTHPLSFQTSLLRAACLVISCMQWASDWIARLRVREATLRAHEPEPPKVVEFPPPPEPAPPGEPVPPLFGTEGLQMVEPPTPVSERKGDSPKRNRKR